MRGGDDSRNRAVSPAVWFCSTVHLRSTWILNLVVLSTTFSGKLSLFFLFFPCFERWRQGGPTILTYEIVDDVSIGIVIFFE